MTKHMQQKQMQFLAKHVALPSILFDLLSKDHYLTLFILYIYLCVHNQQEQIDVKVEKGQIRSNPSYHQTFCLC